MNDIQKIKEFFSKPLNEADFKKGDKITYLGHPGVIKAVNKEMTGDITYTVSYDKGTGKTTASNISNKGGEIKMAEAITTAYEGKDFSIENIKVGDVLNLVDGETWKVVKITSNGNVLAAPFGKTKDSYISIAIEFPAHILEKEVVSLNETMDANDPVLIKARAAAFQRSLPKPEPTKPSMSFKNADKIKALKLKRAQLMRDMEQEAELEGGPIADRYGRELEKIDRALAMLSEAKSNPEVDKLLKIMNTKKAGSEYKKALMDLIAMAEKKSGKTINTKKEALLALDYIEPTIREAKEETAIDMAKKRLDALGVKYEMSKTDKVRPFKVIYKPVNKSDKFYDEFEDIVDLFNLKGFVKSSMNENRSSIKVGDIVQKSYASTDEDYIKEFEVVSIDKNGKAILKDTKTGKLTGMYVNDLHKVSMNEATKDEETEFHKKLDKLVHDTFGKRKGELEEVNLKQSKLSSAEYQKAKKLKDFKASDWKWNADEDLYTKVNEGELTEAKSFTIDSESASDSDKITDFLTKNNIDFKKVGSKIKISLDRDTPKASSILSKLKSLAKFDELNEAELTEAYVPSNIKEFAKRKGVSSLVNKVAGWAEKVGKSITGGTAIGYNYSTLILDMTYQGSEIRINTDNDTVTLYDEPVYSFNDFKQVYLDNQDIEENVAPNHNGKAAPYGSGYKPLEERIAEALDKINEELCPAGKAYIKRRKAAGEKSSAYLSGRAVKVCKGQMSGKAKKKK